MHSTDPNKSQTTTRTSREAQSDNSKFDWSKSLINHCFNAVNPNATNALVTSTDGRSTDTFFCPEHVKMCTPVFFYYFHFLWTCEVDAGPYYFAYVMIIHQPSSHTSLGGCGGTENSQVLKLSTTKNEALSTICSFFSTTGNISRLTTVSQVFWDHLQIFSN